jgi:hypothetical protein
VAVDAPAPDGAEAPPAEAEPVAEAVEPSANGDSPAEEKPKKKTRRGSRGGRRRRKKPAGDAPAEPIATVEDGG